MTWTFPRGHGTMPMVLELVVNDPDTYRSYGRTIIREWASRCRHCVAADAKRARTRRMHAAYGRRSR